MKIRNKILLVLMVFMLTSGAIIIGIWYNNSKKLSNTYLKSISESTMRDAYNAFDYLLTDTAYMATLISLNEKNIIQPVQNLNSKVLMVNGQWNEEYLENRRAITDFIRGMNGYKYYITGIAVVANEECIFSASHVINDEAILYEEIAKLDKEKLRQGIVMRDPLYVEGGKSTLSSDYVVPGVRAIVNIQGDIIGYVVVYFDYGVIENMFSANLPKGSYFQVVNENDALIFSNRDEHTFVMDELGDGYVYNTFAAKDIGWKFYMAIPTAYYVADIQRTAILTSVLAGLILLVSAALAALIVSRMTKEITKLRDTMKQVATGDLQANYLVRCEDEIGQMGQTFNKMVYRIDELMHKVAVEERQKRLNEIAFLQAQINPHFISNVLNNVAWMAKMQNAGNLVPVLNALNSLLHNAMHQEQDIITVGEELVYADDYITVVEYSGSDDFTVEKDIQAGSEKLNIPRFILQPIIENAIHHGLPEDLSRQGCIRIIVRYDTLLTICVEDNGKGMSAEEIEAIMTENVKNRATFNGIGIVNVQERIRLFFGEEYGLRYESQKGEYTKAIFTLPVIKEGK